MANEERRAASEVDANTLPAPPGDLAATEPADRTRPSAGDDDRAAGEQVLDGRYVLGEVVARGGIGRIRRARDRRLHRTVAVKELLHAGLPEDDLARFIREAEITADLDHPAIVPIYDLGRNAAGDPFYCMKLVQGDDLAATIDRCRSFRDRVGLVPHMITVAEALAYAHEKGYIHRDLKPHNILIGPFGETVVIDWGLAKRYRDPDAADASNPQARRTASPGEAVLTQAGALLGTLVYMPPEQVDGEGLDPRSDVYALGSMLYHILSGAPPYAGASPLGLLQRVLSAAPRRLAELVPECPEDLIAITEKAMQRDRGRRYARATELAADLRRFQAGQLVSAKRYTPWQVVRRWLMRHRMLVGVTALALVVLIIAAIFGYVRISREKLAAELARGEAEQNAVVADLARDDARRSAAQERMRLHDQLLAAGRDRLFREHQPNAAAELFRGATAALPSSDEAAWLLRQAEVKSFTESLTPLNFVGALASLQCLPTTGTVAALTLDGALHLADTDGSRPGWAVHDAGVRDFAARDAQTLILLTSDDVLQVFDLATRTVRERVRLRGPARAAMFTDHFLVRSLDERTIESRPLHDLSAPAIHPLRHAGLPTRNPAAEHLLVGDAGALFSKLSLVRREVPARVSFPAKLEPRVIGGSADGRYWLIDQFVDGTTRRIPAVWDSERGLTRPLQTCFVEDRLALPADRRAWSFVHEVDQASGLIYGAHPGGAVARWRLSDGQCERITSIGLVHQVLSLALVPGSGSMIAASADGEISQFTTPDLVLTRQARLHDKGAPTLCAYPGGFASASQDGVVRLWDARESGIVGSVPGERAWPLNDDRLLVESLDAGASVLGVRSISSPGAEQGAAEVHTLPEPVARSSMVSGWYLLSGKRQIGVYRTTDGARVGLVEPARWLPDGEDARVCGSDSAAGLLYLCATTDHGASRGDHPTDRLRIYEAALPGGEVRRLGEIEANGAALGRAQTVVHGGARRLLIMNRERDPLRAREAGRVRLYDLDDLQPLAHLPGDVGTFFADGARFAVASRGGALGVHSSEHGELLATLMAESGLTYPTYSETDVAASFGADLLASSSPAGELMLWDSSSLDLRLVLPGNGAALVYMSVSPDGQALLSYHVDDSVYLWDLEDRRGRELVRAGDGLRSLDWDHTGERIAGANEQGVRVWSRQTGELLAIPTRAPSRGAWFTGDDAGLAVVEDARLTIHDMRAATTSR